jgi:hypothetical protein
MSSPSLELAARLERAEGAALVEIYDGPPRPGDPDLGPRTATIGGTFACALTILDAGFFNRTLGVGTTGAMTSDDIEAISSFYRDLGRKQSLIQVPPEAATPDLQAWLGAAGYRPGRNWVKLWHPLGEIPDAPTDLRVEEIGPVHADAFADIVTTAMEFPPVVAPLAAWNVGSPGWHHYVGFDGDTPVATGAMRIDGDTAWIGFGSTREAARGRGGQSAIFARRLHDAKAMGCTLAVVETGEETEEDPVNHSYRNMLRLGFTLAYARRNWVRIDEDAASG